MTFASANLPEANLRESKKSFQDFSLSGESQDHVIGSQSRQILVLVLGWSI